ncbi:aldehyde dehydrogenase family protein [Rapidithrix thailandica]|uniref:Aldehyde dehydrogenase family protein n=1 Tax=Rapidithrix thailandica TaxID=413964 RepID=A0AAW9SG37_9BACT
MSKIRCGRGFFEVLINAKEKPLALYIYSKTQKHIRYWLQSTQAGNTCINHSLVHHNNTNLPFGGSNYSGIGKSHDYFGFREFSNERGILKQVFPFSPTDFLTPPYTNFKRRLID